MSTRRRSTGTGPRTSVSSEISASSWSQLNAAVEKRDHGPWLKSLKELYLPGVAGEVAARENPSAPIHPARLVEMVRRTMPEDAIFIVDGGDTCYFGLMGLRAKAKSSVIVGAGGLFGCLGTGVPFALAAKLARPEKTVVLINGDGSFGLNAMEFDTAVRHGIPVVSVICNDQAWGMIRHGQRLSYGKERTSVRVSGWSIMRRWSRPWADTANWSRRMKSSVRRSRGRSTRGSPPAST